VEQIVVKERLETRHAGYVLIDETTGETLYMLSDPRRPADPTHRRPRSDTRHGREDRT
jgi:hypothetical protein